MDINNSYCFSKKTIIYEKKKHWLKNHLVKKCCHCDVEFSFLIRKHHCRCCGKIFCDNCSNNRIKIPDYIDKVEADGTIKNIQNYINDVERVCLPCLTYIRKNIKMRKTMLIFNNLPLKIQDMNNLKGVCQNWNLIIDEYMKTFRNIQYKLPFEKITHIEEKMILCNIDNFLGHKEWIKRAFMLQNDDYENNEYNNKLLDMINVENKMVKCCNLGCRRNCSSNFYLRDYIECLLYNFLREPVIKILLNKIKPICNINDFLIWLPLFIYIAKHNTRSSPIHNFILGYINDNNDIALNIYWEIINQGQEYKTLNYLKRRVFKKMNKNTKSSLLSIHDFTSNLQEIFETNTNVNELVNQHLSSNTYFKDMKTPIFKKVLGMDTKNIRVLESKTQPIYIPFITSDNNPVGIIYKREDVRKDYIIMKIISFIDELLKKELEIDFNIITYKIIPLNENSGIIETVENAETIYSICEEKNFTILNYIMEHNMDKTVEEIRERFTKSCAAYCVITYLLGIGDRHLDNVMIHHSGSIFHIDYGYILGKDPKMFHPEIKLTHEMLDVMGGRNGQYYKLFKKYCMNIFLVIRKNINSLYILLYSLTYYDFDITPEFLHTFLNKRILPGSNIEYIHNFLSYKIKSSSKSYSGSVVDFFHKQAKNMKWHSSGSPSAVSDALQNVVDKSVSFGTSVWKYFN